MSGTRRRSLSLGVCAAVALAVSLALLAVRDVSTGGDRPYDFLLWNVFLAAVPYALAALVRVGRGRRVPWYALVVVGAAWLLFLPNAFYIVTDFVHLDDIRGMPVWFDAAMIGSFAATGLLLGFASLRSMEEVVGGFGAASARLLSLGALALSAVGIYLGRVQQFNSWDVVLRPGRLAASLLVAATDPTSHTRALAITAGMGMALTLGYLVVHRRSLWQGAGHRAHPAGPGQPGRKRSDRPPRRLG